MPVEVGLGLQSDKTASEYGRLPRLAEEYGFDVLSVFGDPCISQRYFRCLSRRSTPPGFALDRRA